MEPKTTFYTSIAIFILAMNAYSCYCGLGASHEDQIEYEDYKYRCLSLLGECGKSISESDCRRLCLSWFSGANPAPRCGPALGLARPPLNMCICEHDCMKGSSSVTLPPAP
ncbi:uncharacterized protein LOC127265532 [Andrographis paniculata]|uniref:uncharacterized protein LOC127265532 n=1 Tax=Andrographis paniculata TaxID=175694 RepID=UPI0021E9099E|nr:uncharacterized protein LOC127265532 [Andrographis paniculata]